MPMQYSLRDLATMPGKRRTTAAAPRTDVPGTTVPPVTDPGAGTLPPYVLPPGLQRPGAPTPNWGGNPMPPGLMKKYAPPVSPVPASADPNVPAPGTPDMLGPPVTGDPRFGQQIRGLMQQWQAQGMTREQILARLQSMAPPQG